MYSLFGVVWHSVALYGVSVSVGVYQYFRGVPAVFVVWVCIKSVWCFSRASSGSSSSQAAPLHIRRVPAHVLVVVLGSAFGVMALVCFLVFPLPPLPIQGSWGLSSVVFFFFVH